MTMEGDCPGWVAVEKICNVPGLPHSESVARFRRHYLGCEICGFAMEEDPENCGAYCPVGHDLLHEAESDLDFTRTTARWN